MRATLLALGIAALAGAIAIASPPNVQGRVQAPARDASGPPAIGTAVIGGRVTTDDASPRPIRRATITLSSPSVRLQRFTLTDDDGRFIFTALPPGSYTVSAAKGPYLTTGYGTRRIGHGNGTPIAVAAGQQLTTITIKMPMGSVIAGTITDQTGRPVSNARIQIFDVRMISGERMLGQSSSSMQGGGITTDDRGAYRVYGLAPGEYVIGTSSPSQQEIRLISDSEIQWAEQQLQQAARGGGATAAGAKPAAPVQGPAVGYSTVYYPGAADAANAVSVALGVAEVRTGINFSLLLVPTAKVEGVVLTPGGQPAVSMPVTLSADTRGFLGGGGQGRNTDREGKFAFLGLTPGLYTLSVRPALGRGTPVPAGAAPVRPGATPSGPTLWALQEVRVNGQDVTGLSLTLQPGMTVSGRFVLENTSQTPLPDFSQARVAVGQAPGATPTPGGAFTQSVNADGTFTVEGVPPGRYRVTAGVPSAPGSAVRWVAKSAMVGGKDSFDWPFEVLPGQNVTDVVMTFADRYAELSGTLLDATGQPAVGYAVLVFSTDKMTWTQGSRRTRQILPSPVGRFAVQNLPAGEYYLAAVTDLMPADLYDSTFLTQVAAAAVKFTLADGEKKVQDLRIR